MDWLVWLGQASGGVATPVSTGSAPTSLPAGAGLAPVWVYLFLIGFGVCLSVAAFVLALRGRQDRWALIKSVAGGTLTSGAVAALGNEIGGLSGVRLTWMEAAIVSGLGFLGGFVLVAIIFLIGFHVWIIVPLRRRYGDAYAAEVRIAFFGGQIPLNDMVNVARRQEQIDEAWDEFCLAVVDALQAMLPPVKDVTRLVSGFTLAFRGKDNPAIRSIGEQPTFDFLSSVFERPLAVLSSRMSNTKFNFTLWRIDELDGTLEHMATFPRRAQPTFKEPLPIWKDRTRSAVATLAGKSMLVHQYLTLRADQVADEKLIPRGLGTRYEEIACMPVPPRGVHGCPWAVLCLENRGGLIPLRSDTVQHLMGKLADAVAVCEPMFKRRTIGELTAGQVGAKREAYDIAGEKGKGATPTK